MQESAMQAIADFQDEYWWFVAKNRIIRRVIDRFVPGSGIRSLDVGCGPGGMLRVLEERGEAIGVDLSDYALGYCRDQGLQAVKGSLPDDVPFAPGSFDLIVASEVIEHVEDDQGAAATLVGLLRPGGVLVATVPALSWMWSQHDVLNNHYRRYTTRRFAALFREHAVERLLLSYYNTTLFPAMLGVRWMDRAREAVGRAPAPTMEIKPLPAPINSTMRALFEMEGRIVPHVALPIGGSIIAAYRKRD